jgi:hypothetical protein
MAEDANPLNPTVASESAKQSENGDPELKAINVVLEALSQLAQEQRLRALDYVLRRFNATTLQTPHPTVPQAAATSPAFRPLQDPIQPLGPAFNPIQDIRSLKELKAPKSAIEMAVLVAYYVSEVAPEGERKSEITKPDLERYFKAAGFKLPSEASFTLVNAKNAGYLDSAGAGQYKLNPVGYNLVAHRLGNRDTEKKERPRGRRTAPKRRTSPAKKASRTKK